MCEPHAQEYNLTMNGYLDPPFINVSPSLLSLEIVVYKSSFQIHHTYPLFLVVISYIWQLLVDFYSLEL
jgi:hypothetical protein